MKHSVKDALLSATSRSVIAWQVFFATSVLSMLIHLFGSPEFGTNALVFRSLAGAASVLPMFLLVYLVQVIPESTSYKRIFAVVISYFIGGGLRGWTLSIFLTDANIAERGGWQFRIPSSAIFMAILLSILTFGWHKFQSLREQSVSRYHENQNLQAALRKLQESRNQETIDHIQTLKNSLVGELRELELSPAKFEISQLEATINQGIRPLSKELALDIGVWQLPYSELTHHNWRNFWNDFEPLKHLPAPWWNIIPAIVAMPSAYFLFGNPKPLLVALSLLILLMPSLWLNNLLSKRFLRELSRPKQVLSMTFGFILVAAIGVSATRLVLADTPHPNIYVPIGLIAYPINAWVIILGDALWGYTAKKEAELSAIKEDLRWAVARINLLAWFNRGVFTRLIHGPIQNSLHATLIRLRNRDSNFEVSDVIKDLKERLSNIDLENSESTAPNADVVTGLLDIPRLWAGIALIKIQPENLALISLEGDKPAAAIVLDSCNEICSNAIRHGGAKNLEIKIRLLDSRLKLQFEYDGMPNRVGIDVGIGIAFLNSCSIEWTSQRRFERNFLDIVFPIST